MFGLGDIVEGALDAVVTIAETTAGAVEIVADAAGEIVAAGIDELDDFINS